MGLNVLEAAREGGARQLVQIGTVCSYPKYTPVPFQEKDLWSGYPEETNAAYGIAKRAPIAGSYAFTAQFGLRCANVLLLNLYGEGDNFDPRSSHVIPALIRKCVAAQEADAAEVELWGDGTATRGFLYVEDAVDGILLAARHAASAEPINIGTPGEVSIRDLAETIGRLTGFRGRFRFDPAQPNGQPRRALDCTRAERELGFRARTPMSIGLARTVSWYRDQREQAALFPPVEASATNAGC
jgi:GDP-L-fucose synthase